MIGVLEVLVFSFLFIYLSVSTNNASERLMDRMFQLLCNEVV